MDAAERHAAGLEVLSHAPLNAQPPMTRLAREPLTPAADFYIRTHGDVPEIDPAAHRLMVTGLVAYPLELSLQELRDRFAGREITAALQCAGNRRADLQEVKPTAGDSWSGAAIGAARWTGVALTEVLEAAGAEAGADVHVAFRGADICEVEGDRFLYEVSVPSAKARTPDVLLAWAMNGEPLRPAHGAPLRGLVPGWAGARSCKWLTRIEVRRGPSPSHYQADDYKLFPPHVTAETADPAQGLTIEAMPLNSTICEPQALAEVAAGPLMVRGWATGGDRAVARVDVSADGGRTWVQADLACDAPWSWTLWRAVIALASGEHEIAVRAWDCAGQTQPSRPEETWNYKGYLSAAWKRVRVRAV